MKNEKGNSNDTLTCPFLNKPCIKEKCMMWVMLMGKNPQTGKDMPEFDCSLKWLPIIMVENTQATHGVQAATENVRDVMNNVGSHLAISAKESVEMKKAELEKKNKPSGLLGWFQK